MYLRVNPKKISTLVNCYPESNFHKIQIEAVSKFREVFEIGEDYVFTDDFTLNTHHKNKSEVLFYLSVYNADKQDVKALNERGFGKDKVGEIRFHKESGGMEHTPAALYASVYIANEQYELIEKHFFSKIPLANISFEFESNSGNDDEVTYGWEPDASRMIWKISDEIRSPYLSLKSVDFYFCENDESDETHSPVIETIDTTSRFFKEIKEIKYLLLVIAIPAFGAIFRLF